MPASVVKACFRPPGTANLYLTAILEGGEPGGGFNAVCPELDIASQGETVEEATDILREAVELFLESADPLEMTVRLKTRVFVTHFEARGGTA